MGMGVHTPWGASLNPGKPRVLQSGVLCSGELWGIPPLQLLLPLSCMARQLGSATTTGGSVALGSRGQGCPRLVDPGLGWGKLHEAQDSSCTPTPGCAGVGPPWGNASPFPPVAAAEPSHQPCQSPWQGSPRLGDPGLDEGKSLKAQSSPHAPGCIGMGLARGNYPLLPPATAVEPSCSATWKKGRGRGKCPLAPWGRAALGWRKP